VLLRHIAEREARDAAPDDAHDQRDERARRERIWHERWTGVKGWFRSTGAEPPQADLLRARARSAIPQLLGAIAALNERRSGRSDRSADFRVLARWFTDCASDEDAHRLARAAFALNPARHFRLNAAAPEDLPASTSWSDAPALIVHPRLREYGEAVPRGAPPSIRDRAEARAVLAQQLAQESQQVAAARARLATGQRIRLSDIGRLETEAFGLLLTLLGEALAEQLGPDAVVERISGDGLLQIRLEPLGAETHAEIVTAQGVLAGRDHLITITPVPYAR